MDKDAHADLASIASHEQSLQKVPRNFFFAVIPDHGV